MHGNMLEPIYKAATRPALKWGIPIKAGFYTVFIAIQIGMWGALLLHNGWIAFAAILGAGMLLGLMRWATHKDDQRIDQLIDAFWLGWLHLRSKRFFRCRSYGPIVNAGETDAYVD
jgi:type IV secretion system protein VirB3